MKLNRGKSKDVLLTLSETNPQAYEKNRRWSAPKSPDHKDVHTSRISTQTHQEAHNLKTSGYVWHCTHPPETSAGAAAASSKVCYWCRYTSSHFTVFCEAFCERILGWLTRSGQDFCWLRHRAGAPHTHGSSTVFPARSDESTRRRPPRWANAISRA